MKTKLVAPLVSVLLVALGLLAAPFASAASAPLTTNGSVHACVKAKGKASQRGMLRVVGPNQKCNTKRGWKALNWSVTGPAGNNGAQGPAGAKGANGTNGSNGSNGAQGEKGSDATVESQLKEVIATQTKEIENLTNEVSTLTGGLLNLTSTVHGVEGTLTSTLSSLGLLTTKVSGQCSLLNEVSGQANGIIGGITQLTGGLTTLLPLLSPITLPNNTTATTC